jgi:hypothetical protein
VSAPLPPWSSDHRSTARANVHVLPPPVRPGGNYLWVTRQPTPAGTVRPDLSASSALLVAKADWDPLIPRRRADPASGEVLTRRGSWITRMWDEGRHFDGHPHVRRHRGEDALQLPLIVCIPQPRCAPRSWIDGRIPESQEMVFGCEFAGANGRSRLRAIHHGLRRSRWNSGTHGGEKLRRGSFGPEAGQGRGPAARSG